MTILKEPGMVWSMFILKYTHGNQWYLFSILSMPQFFCGLPFLKINNFKVGRGVGNKGILENLQAQDSTMLSSTILAKALKRSKKGIDLL